MNELEKILHMVKDGTISPEEGESLLRAMNEEKKPSSKVLKIRIKAHKPNKDNADISLNIPLKVLKLLVKATGKISTNIIIKNKSVREALNTHGIVMDENGKIEDIDAFNDAIDELAKQSPVEIINIKANESNKSQADIYIGIE